MCRAKMRFGQPVLLLDLSNETDHLQGVMWGIDRTHVDAMAEKIGKCKEAVVTRLIQEYQTSPGKLQMDVNTIDFEEVCVIIPDSHVLGLAHMAMQTILMIETLPNPYNDLTMGGLDLHWNTLLNAVDPESKRHKFCSSILTHFSQPPKLDWTISENHETLVRRLFEWPVRPLP